MTTSTPPSKVWDHQVDERVNHIVEKLDENPEFAQKSVPGLKELLTDFAAPDVLVSGEDFHRRLLQVFKNSETDGTYSQTLSKYTPEEQDHIKKFVAGASPEALGKDFAIGPSLGCRKELEKLQHADSIAQITPHGGVERITPPTPSCTPPDDSASFGVAKVTKEVDGWFHKAVSQLADFFDTKEDNQKITVYKNAPFQNWGPNITNTPHLTYVPKTSEDVQTIVKLAIAQNLSVRCSGYRHSWSPIFGKDGQVLISMLDIETVTTLPNYAALPLAETAPNDLQVIHEAKTGNPRIYVAKKTVTVPLNIIIVKITLSGSNAPICHGAGRRNMTLSDLVRKIEYVDAHGNPQAVDDPKQLLAASGCFGLMGVVTHITMEFPPMSYAKLAPLKMPVIKAVPPPPGFDEETIPPALLKYWTPFSAAEKHKCQAEFERRATNDYYAEWFWFPYSDYSWVNTWDNTMDSTGAVSFPDDAHIWLSFVETVTMNIL
ncbi:oxidoreductase [Fusarium subglutinans]|uniref:Oxidoreductase n=1 Tax=Gibberella subglutinans TaxID=42677 RepID=A0A8H5L7I4_GIBSU|nr:oxidoreductase [Fusarium subglutinans]KAF5585230.1 oxidoreductase [Fusarium subglutinans]